MKSEIFIKGDLNLDYKSRPRPTGQNTTEKKENVFICPLTTSSRSPEAKELRNCQQFLGICFLIGT